MTLGTAIEEAFGRTEYVRRAAWPAGSVGVIDCLSENPFAPFSCTVGRAEYNWQAVLSAKDGATGSIGRGDRCEVWLDGCALDGGCTLAWVKPQELSLLVARDRVIAWPEAGMVMPLRRVSIGANGLVREFHLLSVDWQSLHDGSRLYRLCVAERTRVH